MSLRHVLESVRLARANKGRQGYSGARPDVVAMIGAAPAVVLDIGCGGGLTAALVREKYPEARLIGVESDESAAAGSAQYVDRLISSSIEDPETFLYLETEAPFDLIILADVLEHLVDPWSVLRKIVGLLAEDGVVITSIPNVRHISTFFALGVTGRWPRRTRGIHDATHLRFFCRSDILAMGAGAGLEPIREQRNLRLVESIAWTMIPAAFLDFWPLRSFLTFQYLHTWSRRKR